VAGAERGAREASRSVMGILVYGGGGEISGSRAMVECGCKGCGRYGVSVCFEIGRVGGGRSGILKRKRKKDKHRFYYVKRVRSGTAPVERVFRCHGSIEVFSG